MTTPPKTLPRREQILAHALDLFAVHGMHNVTTRQIAAAVGISQPSLYAHFATRDAIGVELCRRAFERLYDCLVKAIAIEASPEERLYRLGRDYIRFGLTNEAAYRVAFMTPMSQASVEGKAAVLSSGVRAFSVLRGLYAEVLGAGSPVVDVRAQSCWASVHGLVALLLDRPEFPWIERDALIHAHLEQLTSVAFLADDVTNFEGPGRRERRSS